MNTWVGKQWYAVKVKYKSEKVVIAQLERKDIEAYTPFRRYTSRYLRKIVRRMVPVLSTYVFVHIDRKQYVSVLETEHVFGFVKVGKLLSPVTQAEMDILHRIEGLDEKYAFKEVRYQTGQRVHVNNGALFGMQGIVSEVKSKGRLIVNFDSLGIGLQIEINVNQLEPSSV
ncbi:MAG: UpxY family transcription antiterminator [Candidatus Parvibacillus calidus]|nr:MAG: UpxY family transcription antiterminator [Candidatus Parvibacillus calidus]